MMIAFPDIEGSFSALLFLPRKGDHRMMWGFEELDSWVRQSAFMEANFPDITPHMPALEQEFHDHEVKLMGTVRCRDWRNFPGAGYEMAVSLYWKTRKNDGNFNPNERSIWFVRGK